MFTLAPNISEQAWSVAQSSPLTPHISLHTSAFMLPVSSPSVRTPPVRGPSNAGGIPPLALRSLESPPGEKLPIIRDNMELLASSMRYTARVKKRRTRFPRAIVAVSWAMVGKRAGKRKRETTNLYSAGKQLEPFFARCGNSKGNNLQEHYNVWRIEYIVEWAATATYGRRLCERLSTEMEVQSSN